MRKNYLFIALSMTLNCFVIQNTIAQKSNDTVLFTPQGHYNFNWTYSGYTPLIDRLGRPYVYLATKELGLVTFNISNTMNPIPVDTQTVASLGNLKVTGIAQDSNYLLVSLGDFMNTTNAGLAIFDISNPVIPILLDRWDSTAFNNGTSSVIWQGNYAFLSAMIKGVLILDISNKNNIQFVSQIIPDTAFGPQSFVYHARGLYISGDTLLVADDNGGLRIIDVSDKHAPIEIGKYINNSISTLAAGYYNHVYRVGNHGYCAIDFCGVEVVDVSNPSLMTSSAWLNPWNCTNVPPPFGSWNGSDGHTNEIAYSPSQNVLFFSGADSQVFALDPSIPTQPRIMGAWGQPNDSVGTWGVDAFGSLIALANVHTLGFPFISDVGGLQLLNWNLVANVENNFIKNLLLNVFPNPSSGKFTIEIINYKSPSANEELIIFDIFGKRVYQSQINNHQTPKDLHKFEINLNLPSGMYFYQMQNQLQIIGNGKIIIEQ